MLLALCGWVEIAVKEEGERVKVRESVQENRKGDKRCEILVGVRKYVTVYDCSETENIKKNHK